MQLPNKTQLLNLTVGSLESIGIIQLEFLARDSVLTVSQF